MRCWRRYGRAAKDANSLASAACLWSRMLADAERALHAFDDADTEEIKPLLEYSTGGVTND